MEGLVFGRGGRVGTGDGILEEFESSFGWGRRGIVANSGRCIREVCGNMTKSAEELYFACDDVQDSQLRLRSR